MYFGRVHIENQEDKHEESSTKKRSKLHGLLTNNKMKMKKIGLLERKHNVRITCKVSVAETTTIRHRMTTVVRTSTNGMT